MTDQLPARIQRSAERLAQLIGPLRAPTCTVNTECRLMVQAIAGLVGPDRVRRWTDEMSARLLAAMSDPTVPCKHCKGIGFTFALREESQCPQCCGLGVV